MFKDYTTREQRLRRISHKRSSNFLEAFIGFVIVFVAMVLLCMLIGKNLETWAKNTCEIYQDCEEVIYDTKFVT